MRFLARVDKWGGSKAVRIPADIVHKLGICDNEFVSVDVLKQEQVSALHALLEGMFRLMYWLRYLDAKVRYPEICEYTSKLADCVVNGRVDEALELVHRFLYEKLEQYLTPADRAYLDECRDTTVEYLLKVSCVCEEAYRAVSKIIRTYRRANNVNFVRWLFSNYVTSLKMDEELTQVIEKKFENKESGDKLEKLFLRYSILSTVLRSTNLVPLFVDMLHVLARYFLHVETFAVPVMSDVLNKFLEETVEKLESAQLLNDATVVAVEVPILLRLNDNEVPTILFVHFYAQEGKVTSGRPLILSSTRLSLPMAVNIAQDIVLRRLVKHGILEVEATSDRHEDKHAKIVSTIAETFRKHIRAIMNVKLGGKDNKLETVYVVTPSLTRPDIEKIELEATATTFHVAKVNILEFSLPLTRATIIDDKTTIEKYEISTNAITRTAMPNIVIIPKK